jgi:hypothetical protein
MSDEQESSSTTRVLCNMNTRVRITRDLLRHTGMAREYFISEQVSSIVVSFNGHKYPSLCHLARSDIR